MKPRLLIFYILLLALVIVIQGSVIEKQRDLIRQMATNPECMVQK